jgi:hypothetical protein
MWPSKEWKDDPEYQATYQLVRALCFWIRLSEDLIGVLVARLGRKTA